jgi:hypothetical protein
MIMADIDASAKDQEIEAKEQELKLQFKNAPKKLQWILHIGLVMALLILGSYGVAAFEGHISWGKAILRGLVQAALYFFLSAGVAFGRQRGSWWALLGFAILHSFGASGGLLRMVRLALDGGLNWRDGVIDVISIVRLAVGIFLIGLLLSRDVRNYLAAKKEEKVTVA